MLYSSRCEHPRRGAANIPRAAEREQSSTKRLRDQRVYERRFLVESGLSASREFDTINDLRSGNGVLLGSAVRYLLQNKPKRIKAVPADPHHRRYVNNPVLDTVLEVHAAVPMPHVPAGHIQLWLQQLAQFPAVLA